MVRLPPCLKLTLRATMAVSPTTPESLRRGSTLASKPMLAGGDTFSDCGRGNMKMCTLYLSVNGSVPLPLPPRAVRRQEWTQEIHDQSESLFLSRLLGMSPTPQINEALQLAEVGSVYTRLVSATKTVDLTSLIHLGVRLCSLQTLVLTSWMSARQVMFLRRGTPFSMPVSCRRRWLGLCERRCPIRGRS
jgi:hypothetical protein